MQEEADTLVIGPRVQGRVLPGQPSGMLSPRSRVLGSPYFLPEKAQGAARHGVQGPWHVQAETGRRGPKRRAVTPLLSQEVLTQNNGIYGDILFLGVEDGDAVFPKGSHCN